MILSWHGAHLDLPDLRSRFPASLKGLNVKQLANQAAVVGLSARALRAELHELGALRTPCILHWDLNHFVVLKKVGRKGAVVLDPAVGERRLSLAELSRHFTGVALEFEPNASFQPVEPKPRLRLRQLTGKVRGLRKALAQLFLLAFVLQLFAIAAPLLNQIVVDDVLTSGDRDLLTVVVLGFGLLVIIQAALGMARGWMVMVLAQSLSLQWLGNVFAHLIRLPPEYFEKRHLGDITSRFGAVQSIQRTLTTSAIEAVLDGVMGIAAMAMMLLYAPALAAVVLVAVAAYGLLRLASYSTYREAAAERLVLAAKESSHFLETLRAITPLKLFGREEERRSRWQNLIVDVQNRDVRTARLNVWFATGNTLIFGLENLVVFWLGAKMILNAQTGGASAFTVGMLFAFVSYKGQFTSRVSSLINYGVEFKMLGLHAERLADIVLTPPEPLQNLTNGTEIDHLDHSLELRGISFRYSEGEPWILKDVNLTVRAGESIAITGASGAGKTTLLKIALGLLQPSEGEVLYGGVPMRHLGIDNVRQKIGTVLQEDVLLSGSLADNIAFFDTPVDRARVEACARLAQVHSEIAKMPMGYNTLVGDMGSGLSGGQKQRVMLARALYKQPRILALDEATSDLDLANERLVTQSLAQMKLTRLVIAHRPETIAGAQRVVQLRDGQLSEVVRSVSGGSSMPPGPTKSPALQIIPSAG